MQKFAANFLQKNHITKWLQEYDKGEIRVKINEE